RERVRIYFQQRCGAFARERRGRHLREAARERGLAGARRPGKHDETVRQTRELGELAAVLQRKQRLREQPLLHLLRDDDRVPVLVVMIGRQDVERQHAGGQGGGLRHQLSGRRSSGHSICDTSCMESNVSSASSKSTSGSVSARIVSRIESNMCTRTSRAWLFGSSLKCWCQRK